MARAKILCLFIIFAFLVDIGVAFLSPCPTSGMGKKCIYKCCPLGEYMLKKECVKHKAVADFSVLNVYDQDLLQTEKNVQDTFTVLDSRFVGDDYFRKESVNRNSIGYRAYVLENGDLMLKKPNIYYHSVTIPNEMFCFDYIITKKGGLTKEPKVFVVYMKDRSIINTDENDKYLAVARWISCVFLLLLLVVYLLLPELQNLCGLILMNYVSCLFMAFLLLAVIHLDTYPPNGCRVLTLGIYYFFLTSFCWMSVMSYDIWWTFRGYAKARPIHRRGERFKLRMYCLYAYGVPLLMTIFLFTLMVVDMSSVPAFVIPYSISAGCFLEDIPKMLYLYTPMLILIICNWLFYIMTAFNMWRLSRGTAVLDTAAAGSPAAHRSQRRRFMVYVKLSIVMGLSWLFEIISFLRPAYSIWCISDTYNMLIGLLIFIIFVCKKNIYRKLYKRFTLHPTSRFYPGSSKSYSNSSSDCNPEIVTLQVCGNPKGQAIYASTVQSK